MEMRFLFLFLLYCSCQGWHCGDIDLGVSGGKVCDCSGEVITWGEFLHLEKRCCPGHCGVTSEGNGKCYNSTVHNRITQPCNGRCPHRSDIRDTLCPENITQGSGHQQCYDRGKMNDRTYNCLNRADELDEVEDIRNYSSVVPCDDPIDKYGYKVPGPGPGLMCGATCVLTSKWCSTSQDLSRICQQNFTTTDAELCQNFTFWNNQNCKEYNNEGQNFLPPKSQY